MDDGFAGTAIAAVDEPVLPAAPADHVGAYRRASKADATLKAYRADAAAFEAWCAGHGRRPWPSSPETVAGFLVAEAEAGRSAPKRDHGITPYFPNLHRRRSLHMKVQTRN